MLRRKMETIQIEYLGDHPEYLKRIVEWVYPEWWFYRSSFNEVLELYKTLLNYNSLPIALIAFIDDAPAGTALICVDDPDIKLGISPWLEGLFVNKEFRNRGVGKALVKRIEEIASGLGYDYLYLSTHLECFYENLNWTGMMRLENNDKLFTKKLDSFRTPDVK
jgi:GNAT superfamily N-acetyltransferase